MRQTSIYLISEQVRALLTGGKPAAASQTTLEEVRRLVVQSINQHLKAEYVETVLGDGERIPDGLIKATYENVAVTAYRGKARCILPVMPVSLPFNMGVWEITAQDDIDCQFIPVASGQLRLLAQEELLSRVLGQHLYEVNGTEVLFSEDITALDNPITEVAIRLIVADVTQLGDYDLLPIPSDMEAKVIADVYELLRAKLPENSPNNLISDKQDLKN